MRKGRTHPGSHGHEGHAHHGHAPRADATAAYREAYNAAQPDPGRAVVQFELDAREIEWEFAPGRRTRAWGFNGQIPGPTLEAHVGDVVELRFTNHLPEPTAIHWHGLRLPAAMDGTENVQHPVMPGETFTYRFKVSDAGTFWYHPHMNETVQLERGLYGAFIVHGDGEPRFDAERVIVLDDTQLDREGQIKPPGWWIEQHVGRIGKIRLLNGVQEPTLTMAAGQVERWRVVNAASARYILFSIGDRPFRIIGTDGGLITTPVTVNDVLLAPADRVELAVGPFGPGEILEINSAGRAKTSGQRREPFGVLQVGPPAPSEAVIPESLRQIEPLVDGPAIPTREVTFDWKLSRRRGVDLLINKEQHHRAEPVKVGDLQIWDIINRTPMGHPFHLHGFFFQVLEIDGQKPPFLSWEDTVNIPGRKRVRIAWMPDNRPGEWMYHCHILEHHAQGMMAHFEVVR